MNLFRYEKKKTSLIRRSELAEEKAINFYDPMEIYGEFSNAFHSPFKE